MECSRCGKCCFEPFYRHVRPADTDLWKREGRQDILDFLNAELKAHDRTNPAMAELGLPFHTCKCLRADGPGRFACSIYEVRPITCQEFEVGCSRLCPNYHGKRPLAERVSR